MSVKRALLLIADIGGYTRFMKVHAVNLAHAQEIIGRLLESLIEGARPELRLSKLEGDAAFFYALEEGDAKSSLEEPVRKIRRAFVRAQRKLEVDRLCTCDSCTQVSQLNLKFVAHRGEVALQKVKSYRELAGLDVILLHRMLKNSVPATEYVLMTPSVFDAVTDDAYKKNAQPIDEDFEGVGLTTLHYVDLAAVEPHETPEIKPSFARALWQHILLNLASLIYIFRVKKPCVAFRNMDAALGRSEAPPSLGEGDAASSR